MKTYTLSLLLLATFLHNVAFANHYLFIVKEASLERLCKSKKILTVNGMFPGPTIYAQKGSTLIVDVYNKEKYNLTIHWHGVKQPRNPWSDGPEYITQCPIQPGSKFRQKIILSDEEGTIWWHAHSAWARATVHGAIVVYPKPGTNYPFPKPHAEIPIILGGQPKNSDAFMINGQPGDFYPCSNHGTFKLEVKSGKTYLLRILNAAMNEILFFAIGNHKLTVVGTDGSYTKQLTRDYVAISPGQTLDCLLKANQEPNNYYYMAARAYTNGTNVQFDNTTATAIVKYQGNYSINNSSISLPYLPSYYDTPSAVHFSGSLRSLASKHYPIYVPIKIKKRLVFTVSVNLLPCPKSGMNVTTCQGPNGTRLSASLNNISFVTPTYNILEAYYYRVKGVFGTKFPNFPPYMFNYTDDVLPLELELPEFGTQVNVLKYNTTVELVLQGTNLVTGLDHPMHLHGYNFYVVGWGLGNFDENFDPQNYNLVDPPRRNNVAVPKNGWIAIRFRADNPGVWIMHCHIERHLTWGMQTVFIVKNGHRPEEHVYSPPRDMPPC
ncbi:hypothetical protein HAX54_000267 [Datura stramonium]|uniref:Laccase n=1 Tax=Datura stramonium TaxID=4076 RepID=A0ABS8WS02_DATST|nr:hypothetical protein [Datura stramonium]